jgi:hypothetical protein
MSGSTKKDDPAEISVSGTLYKIEAEMSKGDYSIVMAILSENFGEKGAFQLVRAVSLVSSCLPPVVPFCIMQMYMYIGAKGILLPFLSCPTHLCI